MPCLSKKDRIFVAGHKGLVGSALCKVLQKKGYDQLITADRSLVDLENIEQVRDFFHQQKIDVVMDAAAKVGGILANNKARADFIFRNLQIQNHLIWAAHENDVHRFVFLGSSCIYPKMAPQPIPETALLTGPLEYTNRPYAIAKIAGLELIHSLRVQYKRDYFSVMPTNLYGPKDNFHPSESHVLPGLLRRFFEAKENRLPEVGLWGSGKPLREFLFSEDCADAIVFLAENLKGEDFSHRGLDREGLCHINLGSGEEISIFELAKWIAKVVGYEGKIVLDASKPDGTPRKLLDSSFLRSLGWKPAHTLEEGLSKTLNWFRENRGES